MDPEFDRERHHFLWNRMEDAEKAGLEGRAFCQAILDGRVDPIERLDDFEAAVESTTDAPRADPHLALEAALKAEIPFYDRERKMPLGAVEQIQLRGRVLTLIAKMWHRSGRCRQAMVTALTLLKWLEELSGGPLVLQEVVGRPEPNAVAEAAVNALGIYIASLRRVERLKPGTGAELYGIGYGLVTSYLGPDLQPRVLYSGSDAVGGQWFYRWVHDPGVPDELVLAAFELDQRTRPREERSLATSHARDAEYAFRFGDQDDAYRCGREFILALERYGLDRHLREVLKHDYFAL